MVATASGCVMYGSPALAQLTAVALLGQVVSALQQPRVDLRVGAPVDGEQRLEHRPNRGTAAGR